MLSNLAFVAVGLFDLVRLAARPPGSIDAISLSNICEVMNLEETARTFEQVWRAARPGAGICFRNLMVRRAAPKHLATRIRLREDVSRRLLLEDRSFVYGSIQALAVATENLGGRLA